MTYELMAVINPKVDSGAIAKKIEKFLLDANAQSVRVQSLGRKELGYLIKKQKEADYFLFNFDAPGEAIKGIGDKIRLEQEAVLRYLFIKPPKVSKISKVLPKAEERSAKVTVKTVTPKKTAVKAEKKKKEDKPKKGKTSVKGKKKK